MELRQNASVHTMDGQDVGRVDRVVVDPKTKQVTHIVVRKGFLFTEDKVIPTELLGVATEAGITLREEAGDLHALPPFEETHYVRVSDGSHTTDSGNFRPDYASPLYQHPTLGGGVPPTPLTDPASPEYIAETSQNIPEGTVALKEGAKVIAADGQQVGNIEQVITDAQASRVLNLVIAQGLLVKERRQIPITWVSEVWEDEVHLAVGSHTIDELSFMAN